MKYHNNNTTFLGLLMVQDFVLRQKGTIKIDSQEGKGTTFVIQLPQTTDDFLCCFKEQEYKLNQVENAIGGLVL